MWFACLDLESVLIPELWPLVGQALGLPELQLTTRHIADKNKLNALRLRALRRKNVTVRQIQESLKDIAPLKGAPEFLRWLGARMPFIIVSDCFGGLARPLLNKLGNPAIICHQWTVKNGQITALPLRVKTGADSKAPVVRALQRLGYRVFAVGDSLNDLKMLRAANAASWFRPSARAFAQAPHLRVSRGYPQLKKFIKLIAQL